MVTTIESLALASISWLKNKASQDELIAARRIIEACLYMDLAWIIARVVRHFGAEVDQFGHHHPVLITDIAQFATPHFGKDSLLYAFLLVGLCLSVAMYVFIGLPVLYKHQRLTLRLKSLTHFNVLSVTLLAYCHFRQVPATFGDVPGFGVISYIVHFLLVLALLSAALPVKLPDRWLIRCFVAIGLVLSLPTAMSIAIFSVVIAYALWNVSPVLRSEAQSILESIPWHPAKHDRG